MKKKPNILFIFPDQHRGDAMGCVGHPSVISPNIDRLASQGVVFNRCYTNSPLCMPARASLITGKYVCDHGIWSNAAAADPDTHPSFVRNIRDAGYHTAVIGKTHLWSHASAADTGDNKSIVENWGFEHVHELTGPRASLWVDSPHTDYLKKHGVLEQYRRYQAEHYLHAHTFTSYEDDAIPENDRTLMQSYGISRPTDAPAFRVEPPWPLPTEYHNESYVGATAVEWIKTNEDSRPFFLMVGFPGPHDPFDSPREYRDRYRQQEIPAGIRERPRDPVPDYVEKMLQVSGLDGIDEDQIRSLRLAYYAKITLIDDWVGRILSAVEDSGLMENTWIVYCSDHGEMAGDHGLVHKRVFYDGAARIPCIIRPPSGVKGRFCPALADLIDISATLLDIAGGSPIPDSDGRSLVSKIVRSPDRDTIGDPAKDRTMRECDDVKTAVFSEVNGYSMIREERYKMAIDTALRKPLELYDMENDPDELINRVEDPGLESVRQDLMRTLSDRLLVYLDQDRLNEYRASPSE